MRERRHGDDGSGGGRAAADEARAGKGTLTEGLRGPIQASGDARMPTDGLPPAGVGAALPGAAMARMQPAFGADLSSVRVHSDARADAMGAQAYAQGEDIHLGRGAPDLGSAAGMSLLGHEVAHVVQQRDGRVAGAQGKDAPVVADAALEAAADVAGAAAARGEAVPEESRSRGGAARGGAQAKAADAPIQCFDGGEHRDMGNLGSGNASYSFGPDADKGQAHAKAGGRVPFQLSHGDIVMLSGDYFDPRDTIPGPDGKPTPVKDSLFKLAATPSSNPGQECFTQDEIIYAIQNEFPDDPRFKPAGVDHPTAGIWAGIEIAPAVKAAVDARFLKLASENYEHFANPVAGRAGGPAREAAGGSYRALHEAAIVNAYSAGQADRPAGDAMAHEAAAEHFLTDAFSAGHLRTPRESIHDYWRARYPLFAMLFKEKIANAIAIYMNAHETNFATVVGSVRQIQGEIMKTIKKMTASYPDVGFDFVVGLATHDTDNANGLKVTNDLATPDHWKTMGDGHAGDDGGKTLQMAAKAVTLGVADVRTANELGKGHKLDMRLDEQALFADVKARTAAPAKPGTQYGAEQAMPHLDKAEDNGEMNWKAASIDALWPLPVRTDKPDKTYEKVITDSVRGGAIASKLEGLAAKIDPENPIDSPFNPGQTLATLHPKQAYEEGFLKPMKDNPLQGLKSIIEFDPGNGLSWSDKGEAADAELTGMRKDRKSAKPGEVTPGAEGFSLGQRIARVKDLLSDKPGFYAEHIVEDLLELFASTKERKQLYQGVEGRAWGGNFNERDKLVPAIGKKQSQLRSIIDDA